MATRKNRSLKNWMRNRAQKVRNVTRRGSNRVKSLARRGTQKVKNLARRGKNRVKSLARRGTRKVKNTFRMRGGYQSVEANSAAAAAAHAYKSPFVTNMVRY